MTSFQPNWFLRLLNALHHILSLKVFTVQFSSLGQPDYIIHILDPDVKVACLSLLRVLICTHSSNKQVVDVFWDCSANKCWLIETCLLLIESQSGFPLTLESLLVLGEVTRCNIQLSRPYIRQIVHAISNRLQDPSDVGIQIRCAKALALVCCSILQEMDKEDSSKLSRTFINSFFRLLSRCDYRSNCTSQ